MLPVWARDGLARIRERLDAIEPIDDIVQELLGRAGDDRAVSVERRET